MMQRVLTICYIGFAQGHTHRQLSMCCRYRGPVDVHNLVCMLRAKHRSVNALHLSLNPRTNEEASTSASTNMVNPTQVRKHQQVVHSSNMVCLSIELGVSHGDHSIPSR